MFTKIDKALAAIIMGIVSLLIAAKVIPEDLEYSKYIELIVPVLTTGFTVWLVPNKKD